MMVWRCLTAIEFDLICKIDGKINLFMDLEIFESSSLGTFARNFGFNHAKVIF